MTRALSALVALMLLVLPAAAMAQQGPTNAPPGNSAIDEYLETVPSATGDHVPRPPGSHGGSSVLTAAQRARLEKLGPDGKTLVNAIDATAPPPGKPGEKIDLNNVHGRSPVSAILEAVVGTDGDAGMGFMLPVILLASLLGVIALVIVRRRSVS
jgi:hypothetical protein